MPDPARDLLDDLRGVRAVPVLRSRSPQEAVTTALALADGGLHVVELTFSTPDVTTAVAELAADGRVRVGVGTVTTEAQGRAAVRAGASFLVAPVNPPWLVDLGRELGVPAIPGAATPTEVWTAHCAGAVAVKVFPIARLGGAAYIRDLLAPFPDLPLLATGGVTAVAAGELLAAGCLAVGLGSIHTDTALGASVRERAERLTASIAEPAR